LPDRSLYLANSTGALRSRCERLIPGEECILIGPSRAASDDLLRSSARAGYFGVHSFTLLQLAARLASLSQGVFAPMTRLSQEALAARIVFGMRKEDRLHYFDPVSDRPGFIHALATTLSELRMEGVDPRKLAQTGMPGRDLSLLFREYGEQMEEARLADTASLYERAIGLLDDGGHPFAGLPVILFDVPVRFALEKKFLRALVHQAKTAHAVCLEADERSARALRQILSVFEDRAEAAITDTVSRVRHSLFAKALPERASMDDSLTFFSAPGEALECVEIARRILRSKVPFDRIAVLLRSPERYQPLLAEAFRRAGVPAYFARGSDRPNPSGRALLALLRCASEQCSASRFAEYLSLAQVPDLNAAGEPMRHASVWTPVDDEILQAIQHGDEGSPPAEPEPQPSFPAPAQWERMLVDAAVVGGAERWRRRLRGLMNELRARFRQSDDDAARAQIQRQIRGLEALQRFALPLIEMLAALPAQADWRTWLEHLTALAETALRDPEPILAALHELRPMEEVGPVSLDEVYCVLADRLRFLHRDPPYTRYGRVFVAGLDAARGRSFDDVYLPGVCEGLFPKRAQEDPLFLDTFREKLGSLMTQDDRVARERLLLQTAAAAGARFVISYPRIDQGQSRPRVPSLYAIEILRAAEGKMPDVQAFEKMAETATTARLGWPAPANPSDAIDEVEYDLASLDHFHRLPRNERRGRARYLLQANAILARSLRTHWKRWKMSKWTEVDGIADPSLIPILAEQSLLTRSYSPTTLQYFATCPYRFALHGIHGLRPREEPVALEQVDPLTRGSLFHLMQHELFLALRDSGLLPLRPNRLPAVLDLADRVVDAVAAKQADELAPAIPRVWSTEIDELRLDIRGFIRHAASAAGGWTPVETELAFGLEGDPPAKILAEGYRIRGSVDLVEESQEYLRVTDFKTGKPQTGNLAYISGGRVLQPMLYALAVESVYRRPVRSGRLYYATHRGGYREIEIQANEAGRANTAEALATIEASIRSSFLPAAPERGTCDVCDFAVVCGRRESKRVERKRQQDLDPLFHLRDLP
jgi:RecB family exonuclease